MRPFYIILSAILIFSPVFLHADSDRDFRHLNADLIVSDRTAAGLFFTAWGEDNGGYYLRSSDTGVVLRIPEFNNEDFNDLLTNHGEIAGYSYRSENLDREIKIAEGQLASREKLLSDYYSLMSSSDFRSTLSLEKEISAVLREIEQLKGRIKKLKHDRNYALVEIKFYSEELYSSSDISSFDWINNIDFHYLMEEEVYDE